MENNNGIIPNNGGNTGNPEPKKGFKAFVEKVHRGYDTVRYSKAGKWGARILTALTIGSAAKVAYDKGVEKGKASVVPTVVTIEKIPEAEAPAETPAEDESAVEEA